MVSKAGPTYAIALYSFNLAWQLQGVGQGAVTRLMALCWTQKGSYVTMLFHQVPRRLKLPDHMPQKNIHKGHTNSGKCDAPKVVDGAVSLCHLSRCACCVDHHPVDSVSRVTGTSCRLIVYLMSRCRCGVLSAVSGAAFDCQRLGVMLRARRGKLHPVALQERKAQAPLPSVDATALNA